MHSFNVLLNLFGEVYVVYNSRCRSICRKQGRRLRLASEGDNYGERSEPKNFFAHGGDNPPRNSKTNNAGIKVGGIDPPHPPRCRRLWPHDSVV
jgi:hypothetical protein